MRFIPCEEREVCVFDDYEYIYGYGILDTQTMRYSSRYSPYAVGDRERIEGDAEWLNITEMEMWPWIQLTLRQVIQYHRSKKMNFPRPHHPFGRLPINVFPLPINPIDKSASP